MKQQKIQPNTPSRYNAQPYRCPLPEEVPLELNRTRVQRFLRGKGILDTKTSTEALAALSVAPRHIREAALGVDG